MRDYPAPDGNFWVGMGWAVLITVGMVLVIAAGFRIWLW